MENQIEEDKTQPSKMGCILRIETASDHPLIITNITGISATDICVKGEQYFSSFSKKELRKPVPGKVYDYNLWRLESNVFYGDENIYLNHALENLLDILDSQKIKFKEIFKKYPKSYLQCYGYYYDYHPFFYFTSEIFSRLAFYNINIDFDIYCLAGNEKDEDVK